MPSLSKFITWSAVAVTACVAAVPGPEAENPLDARDVNIIINTHEKTPSGRFVDCDFKTCFTGCEGKGAIGGVCDDSGCHCQYGPTRLTVQKGLVKGIRLTPTADEKCDLETCNAVCYQKGGFAGGVCNDDGSCECVHQDESDKPSYDAEGCYHNDMGFKVCDGNCDTYNDCYSCYLYERCCWQGKCECGTTGRESTCT